MTKGPFLKYILLHYGYAAILCLFLYLILRIPLDIIYYYHLFIVLGGLLLYYHLTNLHKFSLTILSFFLNFIVWTAEQVNLESEFHHTSFYQSGDNGFLVILLGGFLWTTNKIILDFIFKYFKAQRKDKMRLEVFLTKITRLFFTADT